MTSPKTPETGRQVFAVASKDIPVVVKSVSPREPYTLAKEAVRVTRGVPLGEPHVFADEDIRVAAGGQAKETSPKTVANTVHNLVEFVYHQDNKGTIPADLVRMEDEVA